MSIQVWSKMQMVTVVKLSFLALIAAWAGLLLQPAYAAGVVGTGSAASCNETNLNTALSGGGTVTFNCGGPATILITSQKTITQNTVIQGGGIITITGGLATRLFEVDAPAALTLNDITLDSGFGTGTNAGGAIYNTGVLSLTNVTIQNSQTGPSLCGGAIFDDGAATISNSKFLKNTADYAGGAICTGNHVNAAIQVSGSTFDNNKATGTAPNTGKGGAIYMNVSGGTVNVTGSNFDGNTAQFGGAVYVEQGATATFGIQGTPGSILFSGNTVSQNGGAIWNQGTTNVYGGSFLSNKAAFNTAGYGGAVANYGALKLYDSTLVFSEGRFGAGLFAGDLGGGSIADVRRTLFNLGNANLGGGLYANAATVIVDISDSVFSKNTGAYGGGIARLNARVDVVNSSFTDNGSTNDGGNVWVTSAPNNQQDPSYVSMTSVTIAGGIVNPTFNHGGGYYNQGISVLKNVTIKDNPNGIYNTGLSQLNIYNTVLDNPGYLNCDGGTPLTLGGHNWSTDNSCAVETNNMPAQLGSRAINMDGVNQTFYYPPLAGSPLINAAAGCPTVDQLGATRPDACDIGAVEFNGILPHPTITSKLFLPLIRK